jgi:hypothetical protein
MLKLDTENPKFELGETVATSNLVYAMQNAYGEARTAQIILLMLRRHHAGDWGDVCAEDAKANEDALKNGERLLSIYYPMNDRNFKVYVITEWDRSATTVMLASDY